MKNVELTPYEENIELVKESFEYGISNKGFSNLDAFCYAYDDAWRRLNSKSAWMRVSSHVALMKIANEYGITLQEGDPLLAEIQAEVATALNIDCTSIDVPASEKDVSAFSRDLRSVREIYVDTWGTE